MLQGENSLLNSYKSTMQNLEQDKKSLEQKVVKLEASLQESQTNANILSNIDTSGRYLAFRFYLKFQDTINTTSFPFFVNLDQKYESRTLFCRRRSSRKNEVRQRSCRRSGKPDKVLFVTFYSVRHSESLVSTRKVRFT